MLSSEISKWFLKELTLYQIISNSFLCTSMFSWQCSLQYPSNFRNLPSKRKLFQRIISTHSTVSTGKGRGSKLQKIKELHNSKYRCLLTQFYDLCLIINMKLLQKSKHFSLSGNKLLVYIIKCLNHFEISRCRIAASKSEMVSFQSNEHRKH